MRESGNDQVLKVSNRLLLQRGMPEEAMENAQESLRHYPTASAATTSAANANATSRRGRTRQHV